MGASQPVPATQTSTIDGLTTSVAVKAPCRVVSSINRTLSGLYVIGSVTLTEGMRVLLRGQTNPKKNGIWEASVGAWRRARDCDGSRDLVFGTLTSIAGGGSNKAFYECTTTDNPIIFELSDINFNPVSLAGASEEISNTRTLTANEDIETDDGFLLINGASDSTHALPDPANMTGKKLEFFNRSDHTSVITGLFAASATQKTMGSQFQVLIIRSNGNAYYVLQNHVPPES